MNSVTMDETTKMPGVGVDPEVTAYVGLVRMALRDLAPEDLEDLTGGLEADLAELAAESEEPLIARLGEPSAYAAELRSAAGFPPAVPAAATEEPWLRRTLRDMRDRWGQVRRDHPWLEQLRPMWWLLRGAVLTWGTLLVLGVGAGIPVILIGAAVSFWAGLRQDRWTGWRERLVLMANIAAVVMTLPFLATLTAQGGATTYVETLPEDGIWVNGQTPSNFYVFDGQGQRVDGARIFTDQGVPLTVNPWHFWSGDGVEPQGRMDAFPVDFGLMAGWDGWTDPDQGQWTPPMAIPPAFPIQSQPTESQSTESESTESESTESEAVEPSATEPPAPTATDGATGAATQAPTGASTSGPTATP